MLVSRSLFLHSNQKLPSKAYPRKNIKPTLIAALLTSLSFLLMTSSVNAGTLDSFKKDIKKSNNSSSSKNKSSGKRHGKNDDGLFDNFFFRFLFKAVEYTALTSNERVYLFDSPTAQNGTSEIKSSNMQNDYGAHDNFGVKPRHIGDPDLPFLQLEGQFHNVWGDTSALNYKATAGYGMFAYKYEQQFYSESSPDSELTITKQQWLLRLSLGENIELHQGLGTSTLTDNLGFKHEETLYTSPIKIKLSSDYMVEFAPTWTSSYDEYDINISKNQPYYSYKLGYKTLTTGNTSLDGFYLGFSVQY